MDQTVPAHTHGDIHAWPDTDSYEDWMGVDNNAGNWGYQLTPIMGPRNLGPSGIIDITCSQNPIRDIFYLTNQVGDRFDSDDEFGDANFTDFGKEGIYLVPIYDQLANYTPPPFPIYHEHHKKIGDFAYCFAIKAVASLMYWFAYNTNQFPQNPPPQMPVISTNLINNFLYRGQTVNLNVSNLGNTSYPCYEWRLYTCQGDEQHFTQWPVNEAGLQTLSGRFDINFRMRNNIYNSEPCPYVTDDRFDLNYWVDVRIKNGSGVSAWSNKYHIVPKTTYGPIGGGGGCPYIFTFSPDIDNTNFYKPDNNILHRSEFAEFVDQDIKDLYLIRNSMSIVNNKISIIIQESEPDHDYFDQVRLLAVDHPIGTIVGITESNDIVLYDDINITSTDNAILNGTINITPNIQYNHPTKKIVRGYSDDSIYASYSETAQKTALKRFKDKYLNRVNADSLALIGEIGFNQDRILYPVVNKDYVGTAVIISNTDTYTRSFARRENNSAVIIPFSTTTDAVEHVDINWNSDFEVSYFSVVPIAYSGYVVNELPLTAATHTILGDVLDKITDKDANYAEIDTLSTLTLSFDNIIDPESGMKRDYIFETNGRYLTSTSMNLQKQVVGRLNENKEPARFELFLNYPNPFNPKTLIKYNVGVASKVNISVYNLLGQLVQTLVNENRSPGTYAVEFDGTNLASGMYIYKMETETFTDIKKMVLMK